MTRNREETLDEATALSVAKRQWERTFDAISDPLMIIDGGYVIRRANLALADDLGVAIQRLPGRRCFEVRAQSARAFPGQPGAPCAGCAVPAASASGTPQDGELRARGGGLYRLRAYPMVDESQPLVVCSYHDVTAERELALQLGHAEKLAAIGRLAGGVAHEINNPLGGILAFAQILLRQTVTEDEREDYLAEIERSALRCKGIVESLLRFARQSPPSQRSPVVVNDVVREALQFATYKAATRAVEIRTHLGEPLPSVMGNANQLEQVLVNLLSNGFDAIESAAPKQPLLEIVTAEREGRVELSVWDNGTGIADAHLPKLFDPFFSTKEEGKGTGLGLAVTYALVHDHGGTLTVRNRPEGGAVFTVSLPAAP